MESKSAGRGSITFLLVNLFVVVLLAVAFIVSIRIHREDVKSHAAAWEQAQRLADNSSRIKVESTRDTLVVVSTAIDLFKLKHGRYPKTIQELVDRPTEIEPRDWPPNGYLRKVIQDGWYRDLVYRYPGTGGRTYDLISLGMDGREGGEGFDADIFFKLSEEKK